MKISDRQWFYFKALVFSLLTLGLFGLIGAVIPVFSERVVVAFLSIFAPFLIAVFLRYLVLPIDQILVKFKVESALARSLIVVFLLVGGTLVLLLNLGNLIFIQARLFIENDWPEILILIEAYAEEFAVVDAIYSFLSEQLSFDSLMNLPLSIYSVFESVTSFLLTVVLTPIYLFFIVKEGPRIWSGIVHFLPSSWKKDVQAIGVEADHVIRQYFKGRFTLILILAGMSTVGFFILGFQARSILFGLILGILDIVPFVGPLIGLALPLLYSLTDSTLLFGSYAPLAVVIVSVGSQMIQGNLIQPFIMSKETNIHPLLVLSALLFFGYLLGVVGIILAIPLVGTMMAVRKYYRTQNLKPSRTKKA
jgi:predicted PurR-regulated permease PerM